MRCATLLAVTSLLSSAAPWVAAAAPAVYPAPAGITPSTDYTVTRNILFKDIRIEGPVWRLFRLNTDASNLARGAPGSIYDITFENISVTGPVLHPSEIIANEGAPADASPLPGSLHDLTFKNVTINGRPLTRADFIIGKTGVANLRFQSTP